jgi:hypothetical protein
MREDGVALPKNMVPSGESIGKDMYQSQPNFGGFWNAANVIKRTTPKFSTENKTGHKT